MKIFTKYLFKQLMGPLLFGFVTFLSIMMGLIFIQLLSYAQEHSISLLVILKLFVLRIPENIGQAAPIAVLLATLMGLGQLTSHSETIAMRAGGLSYLKLAIPVLFIGLMVSLFGLALNEYMVPASLRAYDQLRQEAFGNPKSEYIHHFSQNFFRDDQLNKRIYAVNYNPKNQTFYNLTIEEFENGNLTRIIKSSSMIWSGKGWVFKEGLIYQINSDTFYPIEVKKGYAKYDLELTPKEVARSTDKDLERKSISELYQYINKYYPNGSERRSFLVDLHLKIAIPFASFVFALLGTPLALRPQRRTNATGFGLCILFILLWYGLMGVGTYFAREGFVSPFFGAWLPNILMAGYGVNNILQAKS